MRAGNMLGGKHRKLSIAGAVLATMALLVTGGSLGLFTRTDSAPVEHLRIALPTTPHAALLYIAASKGYFAEEGLDVDILPVSHGKAAIDLVTQGKADLGSAAEVPFVISILNGASLGIAASVVSVSNEMAVVARRDRRIAAPRDLTGKKIGVTFGTSGEYFLWAFLIRHKLTPESVTLVDVPPGKMIQALSSGTIDAASTWEPIQSDAHVALGGNALSFTEADAYTVTHVVVGRSDFLKMRPTALEKVVRALLKAERFNRAQPQPALLLVAERLKLDVRALETSWKNILFEVDLRQSQLVTLEDEARWAMARGYAADGPVPNFLPHLDPAALLEVRPERVTVVR